MISESPNILETNSLFHQFPNGQIAVNNVSLRIPKGCIYGFLGPNGAGKTTTIRLILQLIKAQRGEIKIFNTSFNETKNRKNIFARVGSMVEMPSLYAHLTAIENLTIWTKMFNCSPKRIEEVLQIVGLADVGKKKTGNFSLGMKQRLGIAIALLHEPELLILDEPTNGLDPNGIIETRELLKKLNREHGVTLLISSHILSEIEKMATQVGIINEGQLKFQGSLDELRDQQEKKIKLFCSPLDKAFTCIQDLGISEACMQDENILLPELTKKEISNVVYHLVHNDIEIYKIDWKSQTLEDIFMKLIK